MTATTHRSLPIAALRIDEPSDRWLPRLTELLDEQWALCAELDALSLRQTGAVGAGETDALLRILGERQVLIERVSAINAVLGPFRASRDAVLARLSGPQRQALSERIARIAALAETIQARDESDRRVLESQRQDLAGQLGGLTRARGAVAAYACGPHRPPLAQDRHG